MKIVFMGTPEFSVPALKTLIESKYEVVAVYSQPPKPVGRGQRTQITPIHQMANKYNIPVFHPISFKKEEDIQNFINLKADIAVVVAYGLLLPNSILQAFEKGCINIHASLLPRWRGAAPIQRAIAAGDIETGVTIMQMNEGLDTGDILKAVSVPILEDDTAGSLHDKLSQEGAVLLLHTLESIEHSAVILKKQLNDDATYAKKIIKSEAALNFHQDAQIINCIIRAFNPWPGAYCTYQNTRIKILKAAIVREQSSYPAGTIVDKHFNIACERYILKPLLVQKQNAQAMTTEEFLRGFSITAGQVLDGYA